MDTSAGIGKLIVAPVIFAALVAVGGPLAIYKFLLEPHDQRLEQAKLDVANELSTSYRLKKKGGDFDKDKAELAAIRGFRNDVESRFLPADEREARSWLERTLTAEIRAKLNGAQELYQPQFPIEGVVIDVPQVEEAAGRRFLRLRVECVASAEVAAEITELIETQEFRSGTAAYYCRAAALEAVSEPANKSRIHSWKMEYLFPLRVAPTKPGPKKA